MIILFISLDSPEHRPVVKGGRGREGSIVSSTGPNVSILLEK